MCLSGTGCVPADKPFLAMMIDRDELNQEHASLDRQAQSWVRRLALGEMSKADSAALERWCHLSPAHAAAFSEASQLWRAFGEAGQNLREKDVSAPARRTPVAQVTMSRRGLIGGALAASAAGVVIAKPPFSAWPSLNELRADFRTGTGEQRRVSAGNGISVQMNTRTSLSLATDAGERGGVELIAGEASFQVSSLRLGGYSVIAAGGRTIARDARFDVRISGSTVRVTCLANDVQIEHRDKTAELRQGQQVTYADSGLQSVIAVDPSIVSAWQHGFLICNMMPLNEVIEELNRYRPGHIVLINSTLGRSPVTGRFRVDEPDEALLQIERAFGVRRRTLPGGVVLLT